MPRIAWYENKIDDYKHISIKIFKDWWVFKFRDYSWTITFSRWWHKTWTIKYVSHLWEMPYIRLIFTKTDNFTDEKKEFDYKIHLKKTSCNYWWSRYWFICPCTWRVCTKLYLQNNGWFCDRKAMKLFYESEVENKRMRAMWKVLWSADEWDLYKTIKYPFRNWKPTRKYQKFLNRSKLSPAERTLIIQDAFLWK